MNANNSGIIMNVIREDRDKGEGTERDTAGIRVVIKVPYLAVVLITEGYWY